MAKRIGVLLVIAASLAVLAFAILRRPAGGASGDAPWHLLGNECEALVVVPELGRLGERLAFLPKLKLAQLASSMAGYGDGEQLVGELVRQWGFDPRSRDSLRAAGIDPEAPLLFWAPAADVSSPVVAVPAADRSKLEKLVATQAANRLGARKRSEVSAGGVTLVLLSVEGQPAPALAWFAQGGYLLVAEGPRSREALEARLGQKAETSLEADARLKGLRDQYAKSEAFAYACPGSAAAKRSGAPSGGALALSISGTAVKLSADVPLSDAQLAQLGATGAGAARSDSALWTRLDSGAFLVGRFAGDPALLKPFAGAMIPPYFRRPIREANIDVAAEIFGNLQPGAAFALRLAPSAQLGSMPQLDPRRTNPFQYVWLQGLGKIRDPALAAQTLDKVVAVGPRFGANLQPREVPGAKVFTTTYQLGEGASVGLKEDLFLVSGGPGQMEALLARLGGADQPLALSAEAQKAMQESTFALHLDVARLIGAVRALPASAYGVGGFAIRMAISRWLDAVDELEALRLSGSVEGKSLRSELVLNLKPAAAVAGKEP